MGIELEVVYSLVEAVLIDEASKRSSSAAVICQEAEVSHRNRRKELGTAIDLPNP
jgi:hypothetical protein